MAKSEECQKKIEMLIDDLSSLESYIQELLNFFPAPLCFVSPLGVILEFNPAFEEISGYGSRDVVGNNINLLLGGDINELVQRVVQKESTVEKELFLKRKNEEELPVSVFVRARKDEQGVPVGVFISAFDLSQIKETERELRQKIQELERFKQLAIGRELKMVELKREIDTLKKRIEGSDL